MSSNCYCIASIPADATHQFPLSNVSATRPQGQPASPPVSRTDRVNNRRVYCPQNSHPTLPRCSRHSRSSWRSMSLLTPSTRQFIASELISKIFLPSFPLNLSPIEPGRIARMRMVKTCTALYRHSSYMDCIITKHSIIAFLICATEEINRGHMLCGVTWRTSDPTQEEIPCPASNL